VEVEPMLAYTFMFTIEIDPVTHEYGVTESGYDSAVKYIGDDAIVEGV